jgi:predicted TIM-barrel fold metal-dependent hydrolase
VLIVDAQVHLWVVPPDDSAGHHLQRPAFTKDDLLPLMDSAGVDRAIIVPPPWDSNHHAMEAMRLHPDRFAVMGHLPLACSASRALIRGWRQRTGMLGLRFAFNDSQRRAWLTDGTADWVWAAAQNENLPVMVWAAGSLPAIAAIAERYPGLRLAIDRLGIRRHTRDVEAFADLPDLLKLAKYPNVAVKATGMADCSTEPYPFRGLQPYLRQIFDNFGPRRVFWGADLTRTKTSSYRQCITHFTEELPWLSQDDKALIMGRALCDWLGWSLPS